MRTEHTPVPWRVVMPTHNDDPIVIVSADGQALFATRNAAIANLITAAPELLEALQALVRGLFDGPDDTDAAMLITKARAAIAKATGGAA